MYCPKCGTKNPDNGKFCRSCGTDIGTVSAALNSSSLPAHFPGAAVGGRAGMRHKGVKDPEDYFAEAVKQTVTGLGFLIVAIVLFTTGVAGGKFWWWAMLFPAFGCFGAGLSNYLKSKKTEQSMVQFSGNEQFGLNQTDARADLPPAQTEYIAPETRYKTGDLVPPSVVENTTRHLEMDKEGKTMTLPKK
jgi:hypothetical protein